MLITLHLFIIKSVYQPLEYPWIWSIYFISCDSHVCIINFITFSLLSIIFAYKNLKYREYKHGNVIAIHTTETSPSRQFSHLPYGPLLLTVGKSPSWGQSYSFQKYSPFFIILPKLWYPVFLSPLLLLRSWVRE